eukprot:Opistho-1_new@89927
MARAILFAALLALVGAALATPPPTTNMLTWLDPMATNAFQMNSDGTHVVRWVDQSPRHVDYVQPTGASQPTLQTATSPALFRRDTNGYYYYSCSYSCSTYYYQSDSMTTSGGSIGSSSYRRRRFTQLLGGLLQPNPTTHIFVVTNTVGITQSLLGSQHLFELEGANPLLSNLRVGSFLVNLGRSVGLSINALTNLAVVTSLLGGSSTKSDVWTFTLQPAIGGLTTVVGVYKNNVAQALSTSVLLGTPPMNGVGFVGRQFEGRISELIIYSDLSAASRSSVNSYLCSKHGLTC